MSIINRRRFYVALRTREHLDGPAYGPLPMDSVQLQDSPINLSSFRERCEADWRETV